MMCPSADADRLLAEIGHAPAGSCVSAKSDTKTASSNKRRGDCRCALTAAKLARTEDLPLPEFVAVRQGSMCALCTVVCTWCTSIPRPAPVGAALPNVDAMRDSGWR
jgi:hypothetical protein